MTGELPQGTVTFLFTDIEGSTRLLHALGPEAYAEALAEHRRVLREAFATHGGVEVDTQGDALFVAFPTATGATAGARAGRDGLEPGPIRVRMGLHTGEPTLTAEGYVGIDVHRGARVAALAHGGQILLTEATRRLVTDETAELGLHRLKDFDGGARLFQLGTEPFAPLRSPGAVELPTPTTRFLGRERELHRAVSTWFEREPRVLTIVGPGGIGKTRFAIELARLLADEADGATIFIPLAPLRDGTQLLDQLAQRLGAPDGSPAALAATIGERRTHLVLDNVEQLLPAAAVSIAQLVAEAPSLRLLVTSRELLRIQGELEFDLPPLPDDEATALFLERARASRPELEESPALHELCRRLDGLPLALELAAARTKLLPPEQLLERLGQRLDLLRGTRDADERHATLRATIAWSHDLLGETEQRLFARLSVFAEGCTLGSAEAVCDADLDVLASLLDKSLIRRRTGTLGEERFWMLETIREYAAERLHLDPELEPLRRRHAIWMLELARSANLADAQTAGGEQRYELILAERDDMRAALDWATSSDRGLAYELLIALEHFWVAHAISEGRRRAEELLAGSNSIAPRLRAEALRCHGGIVLLLGELERGEASYTQALTLFRELNDAPAVAGLLTRFAVHAANRGDAAEARELIDETREIMATHSLPRLEAQNLSTLGTLADHDGDLESALELYRRSVAAATSCGFRLWQMWTLGEVSDVSLRLGRIEEAERAASEALQMAVAIEDGRITRLSLVTLARAALAADELARGGHLWGWVVAEERNEALLSGQAFYPKYVRELEQTTDAAFLAAREAGAALAFDEVVALALGRAQTEP